MKKKDVVWNNTNQFIQTQMCVEKNWLLFDVGKIYKTWLTQFSFNCFNPPPTHPQQTLRWVILAVEILISTPRSFPIDYLIHSFSGTVGWWPYGHHPRNYSMSPIKKSLSFHLNIGRVWAISRWKQKFFFNFSWRLVTQNANANERNFLRARRG